MTAAQSQALHPDTPAHRIGGGRLENLHLKPGEQTLTPPGFSVLLGGTAAEAAEQMRQAFPDVRKFARLHQQAEVVGSSRVELIRQAGFDVHPDPSAKFPNHARVTHPDGVAGFTDANLEQLVQVFQNTITPRS